MSEGHIARNKTFAMAAILTFALGVGSAMTVFSVNDAVLLRPATFSRRNKVVPVKAF